MKEEHPRQIALEMKYESPEKKNERGGNLPKGNETNSIANKFALVPPKPLRLKFCLIPHYLSRIFSPLFSGGETPIIKSSP